VASIRSNSERNEAELARLEADERFRLAFEENIAPMICTNLDDLIIAANGAFCAMVGFSKKELIGHDSKPFTYPDDIAVEVSRSPARDDEGKTMHFSISERDITEERVLTAQLPHLALHDPRTGLANRALFDDRLAQAHARGARRRHGGGAVAGPRRL
jgi:PAS domain-containing protein